MPLIKMQTANPIDRTREEPLLKAMSDVIAKETGKPAAYIMATIEQTPIMLAEESGNAALFDIRGIGGLTQPVNEAITKGLCTLCEKELGIPASRVYATFTDVARPNWGWNNATF
ncbi:MAG: light-inducible protein [Deltaproteobacteria bacterium]|nr:light-inducible protein [Deltaproteobacteria bacterium]MBN2674371.1 light-inducible protein [Deltaproteobacteria bacterium]